uniref:cyclin-dependent kinase 5 activator 2-like n=1 Tax=Scatophagus argus TaxID=75038 RepID=UPI001ED83E08|nr:cyclin-dependent kinase 5 activator 2-like [Scatophagus argus]XP_046238683.1 cyclin-dependent kinase 5 activator 2-like [Scatophagus argus]XP_046238684.1 cyclin-dependent kinase 5 activator 2-like [Scatophagus argus]XP_046238686.1 cyclin-dependent kinase 5 activator 2-like [Scatophagus argus]XP_046238687.1 cyclin-dependent kinase 5 activator 2-like [Scatophagus argus]XP_046238688.1 cyclin-dependent kinase 5 activator 2-like [Scatophagus argus]
MGTMMSLSPGSRKSAARGGPEKPAEVAVQKPLEPREEEEEEKKDGKKKNKKKRHPVLLQALSWKKRLVAAQAKRKGGKKVKPAVSEPGQVQREQVTTDTRHRAPKAAHRHGPIAVPVPTVPEQSQNQGRPDVVLSPRRVVVQASTGELLRCLSDFLCRRCVKLKDLSSNQIVVWFRNVDRALLVQGWQDQCFISPASLVFVYLLCREAVDEDTSSEQELHATFLTCLYLGYSYLGNEISYPLKPFLVEPSRDAFWERALELINRLSADMLRINVDPHFFTELFQDLKNQGVVREQETGRKKEQQEKGKENEDEDREKIKQKEEKEQEKENNGGNRVEDLDR